MSFRSCKDAVSRLLDKREATRLGSKSGASEVKQHKWFAKINWGLLRNTQPPVSVTSSFFPVLLLPLCIPPVSTRWRPRCLWDSAGVSSGVGVNRLANIGATLPIYSGRVLRLPQTLSRADSGVEKVATS